MNQQAQIHQSQQHQTLRSLQNPQPSQETSTIQQLSSLQSNHGEIPSCLKLEELQKNQKTNAQEVIDQNKGEAEHSLKRVKSVDELKCDFKENEKILSSLSFNIDDLFKKINSLTQSVQSAIEMPIVKSVGKIQTLQSVTQIKHTSPYQSEKIISLKEPTLPLFIQANKQKETEIDYPISMKIFQVGRSLGHGKFGEVLSCRHKETGFLFALKKIFKSTIEQYKMEEQVLVELEASKKMNHPNIIKSYTSFSDEFHIFLLSEYAKGTKLTKKFKSSQQDVRKIVKQVLDALKFMHSVGVVHRDLKPQNILIDEAGIIKICDFGWSHLIEKNQKMNILCGTLDYVTPEMVENKQYTKLIDLWSVGVLTYELLFGIAPFKGENKKQTFEKVRNFDFKFIEGNQFSENCLDFITKLLQPQENRLSLEECENHPFLQQDNQQNLQFDDFNFMLQ